MDILLSKARPIQYYFQYPSLGFSWKAKIINHGQLDFGEKTNLGDFSEIIVPRKATLRLADEVFIGDSVRLSPTGNITVGARTSLQDRCIIFGNVRIGSHCIFAHGVYVSSGRHQYDFKPHLYIKDQDQLYNTNGHDAGGEVTIADDCWIGANVVILPGTSIGKGSVVAANAVVKGKIPPYSVVGGVPAKILKQRLSFQPPGKIDYKNELDWPYFYSGFDLRVSNRNELQSNNGLAAGRHFQLALGIGETTAIEIRLAIGCQGSIHFQGQSYAVAEDQITLKIPIGNRVINRESSILDFEASGKIIVQGANIV